MSTVAPRRSASLLRQSDEGYADAHRQRAGEITGILGFAGNGSWLISTPAGVLTNAIASSISSAAADEAAGFATDSKAQALELVTTTVQSQLVESVRAGVPILVNAENELLTHDEVIDSLPHDLKQLVESPPGSGSYRYEMVPYRRSAAPAN